ncbi:hypothetical protein NHF50_08300 [Flavobacterium sp. NRK F10]|uniref:hypothetical protein n=1 Tax=Flavobacterium sp. NRK F10 TaxID=2954931 RepID=UPI0020917C2B|nr:hypothetical protein [Flavobacterium sp. NRK F10]MCO6175047.1 hypothetical protein [Flavobacterium sp. NRK F10]
MKNIYLCLFLFSLTSFSQTGMMGGGMRGQRPSGPPPENQFEQKDSSATKMSVEEQLSFLKEHLNLDELQELLVREELIEEEKKRTTSFNPNTSPEELKGKMEAEKKKKEEKFKKILSEEQFRKWKELETNSPKGSKFRKQNIMTVFQENVSDLNLTEAQKKAIDNFTDPEQIDASESFDPQKKEKEFEEFLKSTLDKKQYKIWKKILKKHSLE